MKKCEEESVEVIESTAVAHKQHLSSIEEPPELELKPLPEHLQYVYLEAGQKLPVIIATDLKEDQKDQLVALLKKHKKAIAW